MAVRRDDSVWCALRVFCAQGEADHASEGEGRGEDSEGQAHEERRRARQDGDPRATYLAIVKPLVEAEIDVFRRHALASGRPLPLPLPDVARHATRFGERLVVALRAKLLPALLAE